MSDQIRINGNILSWGSITCKIGNVKYTGLTGLSYGDKRERVKAYGMGVAQAPRARSRGKYTTDPVKVSGPKSTMAAIRSALAAQSPNGASYGDVECQVTAQYFERGDVPLIVVIERCVWVGESSNEEESPDPLKEEAEFDCMQILRNGLTLFDSEFGLP